MSQYSKLSHSPIYPLYDENNMIYEWQRFPWLIATERSVRFIVPGHVMFPRNHITNDEQCTIRMSNLIVPQQVLMVVSPKSAVIIPSNMPILPARIKWKIAKFDMINLTALPNKTKLSQKSLKRVLRTDPYEIEPIKMDDLQIPDNNMAVLNFGKQPKEIKLSSVDSANSNFCQQNVTLSVALNTQSDFMLTEPPNENNEAQNITSTFGQNTSAKRQLTATRPKERDDFLNFLRSLN